MEREKAERENRFKKAADQRRKEMKSSGGDDAIAAAIARVKAQKTETTEKNRASSKTSRSGSHCQSEGETSGSS